MLLLRTVTPEFLAVNDGMFPVPEAVRPIEVSEFFQLNTVPGISAVNCTTCVRLSLQTAWLASILAVGLGFSDTVSLAVFEQPFGLLRFNP